MFLSHSLRCVLFQTQKGVEQKDNYWLKDRIYSHALIFANSFVHRFFKHRLFVNTLQAFRRFLFFHGFSQDILTGTKLSRERILENYPHKVHNFISLSFVHYLSLSLRIHFSQRLELTNKKSYVHYVFYDSL